MELWIAIGTIVFSLVITQIVYRWMNPKGDVIKILPDKPTGPPPIPKVYGTVNPIYAITTTEPLTPLTKDQVEKMQKELENHLFSILSKPHHKIPVLESFKRKEEKNDTKETPKRKITY